MNNKPFTRFGQSPRQNPRTSAIPSQAQPFTPTIPTTLSLLANRLGSPPLNKNKAPSQQPIFASPKDSKILKNVLDQRKNLNTPERSISPSSFVMSKGNELEYNEHENKRHSRHSSSISPNPKMNRPGSESTLQKPFASVSPIINDYLLVCEIGQGSYGKVYKAEYLPTKTPVAVKIYPKATLTRTREISIKNEINILLNVDHPNVVKFIDCFSNKEHIFIVMELLEGENLYKSYKKGFADFELDFSNHSNRQQFAKAILVQLSSALAYLHERNINHRDIKLDNIVFDSKTSCIKLIDFGFAKVVSPQIPEKIYCGTPSYMSPEALMKEECISLCVDLWAVGVCYYTILCGKFPFRGSTDAELFESICKKKVLLYEWLEESEVHIINRCLTKNWKQRINATQLQKLIKFNQ